MQITKARKAVFVVEYNLPTTAFCGQAVTLGFNAMKKNLSLDAFRAACPSPKQLRPPSSLRIESARMNQERTFFVSGFFWSCLSALVSVRGYEVCLLLRCERSW